MGALVRPLVPSDFDDLRTLYTQLTKGPPIGGGAAERARFQQILDHPGTTIFGAELAGHIISAVTLHLLPNLTNGARPYGLVENVVTHADHRGQGYARAVMAAVIDHAWAADAYKLMLLTGQGRGALGFYQKMGFSGEDKHGLTLRR